jgi:hypothetical protein
MTRKIRKAAAVSFASGLIFFGAAGPGHAAEGGPPPHGHVLVLGVDMGGTVPTYRKCIDLAHGKALKLNAHHASVHTGTAGDALWDIAGHGVIPTAPLTGLTGCANLDSWIQATFGGGE